MVHVCPIRPERAEAPSPGAAPWVIWTQTCRPVRAKAFKYRAITKPPSTSIRTSIAYGKPAGFRDPGWTSEPPISLARFALYAGQRDAGGRGVEEEFLNLLLKKGKTSKKR